MSLSRFHSFCLLLLALAITAAPLIVPGLGGDFAGTDDQAMAAVAAAAPEYAPWFSPLWEPPSAEIESLLFALQAALGAGVLGYVVGRLHSPAPSSSCRDRP